MSYYGPYFLGGALRDVYYTASENEKLMICKPLGNCIGFALQDFGSGGLQWWLL